MAIYSKLQVLAAEKGIREGRRISYRVIAEEAGLHLTTVAKYGSQKVARLDIKTVEKLCAYFKCGVGDLLEYVPPGEK